MGSLKYNDAYNISLELFNEERYEEAIEHAKKGLSIAKEIGYSYNDKFLFLIGDSYAKMGKYEECIKWWPINSEFDENYLDKIGYRFLKNNILDMAEKYFKQHLIFCTKNKKKADPLQISNACSSLGEIYLFKNQPEVALSFLRTAEKLGDVSKKALKIALQYSNGMEKRDEILNLISDELFIVEEKYRIKLNKKDKTKQLLKKATKDAIRSFSKVDYKNKRWKMNLRYYWLISEIYEFQIYLIEIKIIDKYWTRDSTNKLKNLLKKYRWEAWLQFYKNKESIFNLKINSMIKKEFKKYDIDWNSISPNYIKYKMKQKKISNPLPRIKKCKICKSKFFELNSIGLFNWDYCYKCTLSAYRGAFKRIKSRDEMIKDLRKLVENLGFIPPNTYMKGGSPSTLLRAISKEKIQKIFPIMVDILPSETYDLEFGSWLKALIESGVLHDGVRKNTYGYMCIAKDGHECRSLAEKIIDDWFYDNQISHQIEPYYPFDDELNPTGGLRADWQVFDILIEFFGLTGKEKYDEKTRLKEELAKKKKVDLITIFPKDLYNLEKKLGCLKTFAKNSGSIV